MINDILLMHACTHVCERVCVYACLCDACVNAHVSKRMYACIFFVCTCKSVCMWVLMGMYVCTV